MNQRQILSVAVLVTLSVLTGCSKPMTAYEQYEVRKARHDAAAARITELGGSVFWEDPGVAVTLHLSDNPTTREAMSLVHELMNVDSVTLIKDGTTDWDIAYLGKIPSLRYLCVRDAKLTQSGVNYLKKLPKLTSVHLFDTGLDDYRLTNLIEGLPQMTELTVAFEPHVTDTSIARLDRLEHLAKLTVIDTQATRETVVNLVDKHPTMIARFNDETFKGEQAGQ
ncbi:MAG: hypothetical protein GC162_09635 [Planctomycetes bacterium]|nr:hypothetical protein [Planctomycetota bacterium]